MTRPLTITAQGNAQISTTQSKFGGSSLLLDGTGDYLNIDSTTELSFGTSDFCMEAWIYKTGGTSYHTIFDMRTSGSDGGGIILGINNVNQIYMYYNFGYRVTTAAISNNTWTHIALARVSGETRVFINGTQSGSTYTDTNNYAQRGLHIGADPLGNYAFPGYMDDVRVSKGNGRYSSTFTPSVYPLSNDSDTSLLINANGVNASTLFVDNTYEQTDSDGLYIVDSYLTPDGYYVYVAEAAASCSSSASISATVGVIKSSSAALSVVSSQTVTISHIHGADLNAFSDGALTAQASVIREGNIAATATFSAAIDAVRGIYVQAQADSTSSLTSSGLRSRAAEAAINAAFSLACDATVVIGGTTQEASASLSSSASISIDPIRTAGLNSTVESTSSLSIVAIRNQYASSSLTSSSSLTVSGVISVEAQASCSSTSALAVDNVRTRDFDISASGAFTPSLTVDVFKNSVAVLDSTSSLSANIAVNKVTSAELASQASLATSITKTSTTSSSMSASVSLVAGAIISKDANASLTANATLTANNVRTRDFASTENALFSPSIVVNIFKNSFAVLDSVASLTAEPDALTKSASAGLSSSFALNSLGGKQIVAAANLSSQFTVYADKDFGGPRPVEFVNNDPDYIIFTQAGETVNGRANTGQTKYGTHSIMFQSRLGSTTSSTISSSRNYKNYWNIPASTPFAIEFWVYITADKLALADPMLVWAGRSTANEVSLIGSTDAWGIGYGDGTSNYSQLIHFSFFNVTTQSRQYLKESGFGDNLDLNVWKHIAVNRDSNGVIRLWENGSTLASITYNGRIGQPDLNTKLHLGNTGFDSLQSGYQYNQSGVFFDEVSFRVGSSTISGLSSSIKGINDYQRLLQHFDNSLIDDTTGIELGIASLTSTAALTASGTKENSASASLTSTASLTASASKNAEIILSAFSNASLTASALRVRLADSATNSTVSLSTTVQITRTNSASLSSNASLTANNVRTRDLSASWSAFAAELIVGDRFAPTAASLSSQFTQTAQAVKTARTSNSLGSTASLAALTNNSLIKGLSASLSASAGLDFTPSRTRPFQSDLTVAAAELAAVVKIGQGLIALDSTTSLTVQGDVTSGSVAHLDSASQLVAQNVRLRLTESSFVVTATLTANAVAPKVFTATLTADTALTCAITKTTGIIALEAGQATLTADSSRIRPLEAHLEVSAFELAVGSRTQPAQVTLTSQTSLTARLTGTVSAHATLTGFAATLSTGSIVHIDPKLTWTITAESRDYVIQAEQRIWAIQEEDRLYDVIDENRVYTVTRELLEHDLQGP